MLTQHRLLLLLATALIVPLFIIICFELGYQVHKKRGVNYCCIRFEEGHRKQHDGLAQTLRFFPWVLALVICVLSLAVRCWPVSCVMGCARFSLLLCARLFRGCVCVCERAAG